MKRMGLLRLIGAWVLVLAAIVVVALVAGRGAGGDQDDEIDDPMPTHGKDVGEGKKLWVFVTPHRTHDGSSGPNRCVDGDQLGTLSQFASPKSGGMTFTFYRKSIPSYLSKPTATGAVAASFGGWDAINTTSVYFDVLRNDTDRPPGFKLDGKNTVGWRRMGAGTLAAVSAWSDANGNVLEADLYYNNLYGWNVFAACDLAASYFDVQGVGTHEIGHTIGKLHLSDEHQHATMFPSAYPGQIKNRTITTGETGSPNLP